MFHSINDAAHSIRVQNISCNPVTNDKFLSIKMQAGQQVRVRKWLTIISSLQKAKGQALPDHKNVTEPLIKDDLRTNTAV